MRVRMKALRTFRGTVVEGRPKKGEEFETETNGRVNELEAHGLAMRVDAKAIEGAPSNKMDNPPLNKSEDGSLPLPGGATGPVTSESLSAPARRQRPSRSKPSEGKPES